MPPKPKLGIPREGFIMVMALALGAGSIFAFAAPSYDKDQLEEMLAKQQRTTRGVKYVPAQYNDKDHQENNKDQVRDDPNVAARRAANFQADGIKAMLERNRKGELDGMVNPRWGNK